MCHLARSGECASRMSNVLAIFRPSVNLGAFLIPLLTRVKQISTGIPVAGTREPAGEKEPEKVEEKGKREKEQSWKDYNKKKKKRRVSTVYAIKVCSVKAQHICKSRVSS